jgi:hypothetical protein
MSDQIEDFDRVFREKLGGQTATPPESVWENIQEKRTYGHVVTNRVMNYWKTFGTMMLILFGGSLGLSSDSGQQVTLKVDSRKDTNGMIVHSEQKPAFAKEVLVKNESSNAIKQYKSTNSKNKLPDRAFPSADLLASVHEAGFSKPNLVTDKRLNTYIKQLDGWESAKPSSFVRYDQMELANKRAFLLDSSRAKAIRSERIVYDYAIELYKRRPFKDRAYWNFAFTPQSIQKVMTPKFNLSTDYLEDRAKAENTRLAYTFTAGLHYELKNHKFFETGINLTQIYEEMSFEGEKRFSNQYDFVEIPFLLGYKDRNAKWGWHIKGGFGIQVFNNYKGYILKKVADPNEAVSPSQTPANPQFRRKNTSAVTTILTNNHSLSENQDRRGVYDLSNEAENPYRTTGIVNLHLAAGITYHHSIKTSFLLTPHYSRSINTITKSDALFNERINAVGISLGTLVRF